ncbi:MAG: tyrosine-type recombinase/integrase [Saprospiraceae bacterium]|nr:tyrosine-type recombinase/integrase [Candidatus Defluviibacterium haderslevense]
MLEIQSFLRYISSEKRYSPHTVSSYALDLSQFQQFILNTYDLKDLAKISHLHIRSWLASLSESQFSTKTICRKIATLKSFFKFSQKINAGLPNPMRKIISPKIKKRLPVIIQEKEINALSFESKDQNQSFDLVRDQLVVFLLYQTGMRRAELLELSYNRINLAKQQIKVIGKGKKERIIPIGKELQLLIVRYLDMCKGLGANDKSQLILTKEGKPAYPRLIHRIVNKYLSTVSVSKKKSPHVLRHSFATHMMDHGADIFAIKSLLGHSTLTATQIYTHNAIEQLRDIYIKAHPKSIQS